MKAKIKKLRSQLPYLPKTFKLIWEASRWWTVAWGLLLVLGGVLPVVIVYLVQPIIDGISRSAGKGVGAMEVLTTPVIVLGITLLLLPLSSTLLQWVRSIQAEKVQDAVKMRIQAKAISLPLAFFETPRYHDMLYRAKVDAQNRPTALLENFGSFAQNSITLAGLLAIIIPLAWWLPVLLLLASLPALAVALRFTLRFHAWRTRHTANERKLRYLDYVVTDSEHAAELRLFGLGAFFSQRYWQLRDQVRSGYFSLLRSELFAEIMGLFLGFIVLVLVMGWVFYGTLKGEITVGELSMFYIAFTQGQRIMRTMLGNISELYKNILFLENLFEFLSIKTAEGKARKKLPSIAPWEIEFDAVSFRYPHSGHQILNHLSFTLPPGKITAIVGTNGAGKSTLLKLLCRFYEPDSGTIRLGGMPLDQISPEALRAKITVLFQNHIHYHMRADENIALGSISQMDHREAVHSASVAAGSDDFIQRLSEGYETMLGRWFGGEELSGGEWQRIALARAFIRDAELILLDEPTSALDSWAEIDWLSRFRSLCEGKTALIITHRFTTARHADVIHVMDKGEIVESGTHHELLKLGGRYASSWEKQTREFA
ncbi:MAG: ABC transporter ATP-binding protein [Sulfurovum sp.]|nr:ABC transporter ATP-binding protein [Sulfurovum sp.]